LKKSKISLGFGAGVALAAVGLGVFLWKPVQSQNTGGFASVNIGRCVLESKQQQQNQQEMDALNSRLTNAFQLLQQNAAHFLTEKEMRELADLYEKPQPSAEEKKRIGALEAIAGKKKADLKVLETTPSLNDAQKKQLEDLTNQQQVGVQMLQTIGDGYKDRVEKKELELAQKFDTELRAAITKVAQDKGYSVVFDNKTAVYAANDATNDVLKVLNK
jgi:Skp family chaperone for outer membrane proteins